MQTKQLHSLITLLDDDDVSAVSAVLLEILRHPETWNSICEEMQESESPKIRRQLHALNHIIDMREHRKKLAQKIQKVATADFMQVLMDLHFLWFDNDPDTYGNDNYRKVAFLIQNAPSELHVLQSIFSSLYTVAPDHKLTLEHFLMGELLTRQKGSDVLIVALLYALVRENVAGAEHCMAEHHGHFGLLVPQTRELLMPHSWEIVAADATTRIWSEHEIVRYITTQIFTAAALEGNYRYYGIFALLMAYLENAPDLTHLSAPFAPSPRHKHS